MDGMAVATIAGKSSLSLVRVLADSFHRHHPDIPFFVLLADEVDGYFEPREEPFRLVRLADLGLPNLPRFLFQYSQQELTYAVTPSVLRYLLEQGFPHAAFLKQESLLVGDLTPVLDLLRGCSIVLTPHLLEPLPGEAGAGREINILQAGVYNVGFLGVSSTPTARAFLSWWEERLYEHCRRDVAHGMHFEQRWLDLVPAFFEDVEVVRDPGFNVAHWNLPERTVAIDGERITVDGVPGRFFRFSGFDPERPHDVTRYFPRLNMSNVGPAAEIFERYLGLLEAAGYNETRAWPYAYGRFSNGRPVTNRARHLYRRLGEEAGRFGDPFDASGPGSFFGWSRHPRRALESMKQYWWALHRVSRAVRRALASRPRD